MDDFDQYELTSNTYLFTFDLFFQLFPIGSMLQVELF